MKKLGLLLMSSAVIFAQDFSNMRLLDAFNQAYRNIEFAKKMGLDQKDPYHFEKAKTSRDIAFILASDMDEVGSRLFMVKSFSALSKANSANTSLDQISFIEKDYEKSLALDIASLNSGLKYARENKALSCAPRELARAEAYYDAVAYELSKPKPTATNLIDFYVKAKTELNSAIEKVNIAKDMGFECYTGKPFEPLAEQPKPVEEEKPPLAQTTEEQALQGEPLMVTARVHFDFNKHSIKREYIPLLNEVVKVLKENPGIRVRIEGFTDNIGSKAYNDKLALRRAQAVKDYLVKAGIPAERIEVAGFGKERYIADNTTPIGRFTNRRAEFIVIQVPTQ